MSRKKTSLSRKNKEQNVAITEIKLPQVVDITTTADIKEKLLEAMKSSQGDIVIDSSGVTKITTPGMQVLLAAAKMLEPVGRKMSIVNAGDAVREPFSDIGLFREFKKWSAGNV